MRFSSSRSGADADVIRARLRAMLEERPVAGWVPEVDDGPMGRTPPAPDAHVPWPAEARPDEPRAHPTAPRSADLPAGLGRHRAPGRAVRWDPGGSGTRALWITGLVAALLLVGWTWIERPRVEPAPSPPSEGVLGAPARSPAPPVGEASEASTVVVASVVGLVARPGLVTLPAGARVADAVEAAGGLLPGADPASVNLAAPVPDGAQIAVGVPGGAVGPDGTGTAAGPGAGAAPGGRVDLNAATAAELDALPGIGPVLAQRIVAHRGRHGPFRSVEQLDDVPGIGPAIAAELADQVRV